MGDEGIKKLAVEKEIPMKIKFAANFCFFIILLFISAKVSAGSLAISGSAGEHLDIVVTGDFNGDNITDYATCSSSGDAWGKADSGIIRIYQHPLKNLVRMSVPSLKSSGTTYVYKGGTTASDADITLGGEAAGDYAGSSCAVLDANKDGIDDLLVGAYGEGDNGAVYLVLGSSSSSTFSSGSLSSHIKYTGENSGDAAGFSVTAGDFNDDGYDDMLVGASEYNNTGAVYLILGSVSPASASLSSAILYEGETSNDNAGGSVANVGDVNADGYDDMLVGACGDGGGGDNDGRAYLILGNSSPSSASLSTQITYSGDDSQNETTGYVGYSVAVAGDVNGDGYDDMLIGGLGLNLFMGGAYLVLGNSSPSDTNLPSTAILYSGVLGTDYLAGSTVAGAGDVNKDGYDDFLIGSSLDKTNGSGSGAAYLVLGSSKQVSSPLTPRFNVRKFLGPAAGDYAGSFIGPGPESNSFFIGAKDNSENQLHGGRIWLLNTLPDYAEGYQRTLQ